MAPTPSICYRARWVLPIERAPVENGWVLVADQRIVEVGQGPPPASAVDLGDVALLPGLVNAHTHLELSGLAGRVPPADSMPAWIRRLLRARADDAPAGPEATGAEAIRTAIASARRTGTVLAGDITNSLAAVPALTGAGMAAVTFHELLGFRVDEPAPLVRDAWARLDAAGGVPAAAAVVAHAPYSVSPALFAEIARQRRAAPLSVHAGESPEEIEFLLTGAGPFRDLLVDLGAWNDRWTPPGCGPIEYLARVGYLQPGMLAVHGGHLSDADVERLRDAGGVLVACPRSNVWVGAGAPDAARFYRLGVPVALGTDSLASVASLDMFDEVAALARAAPGVAPARLLESATRVGACALGAPEFGAIRPGARAALIAVSIPAGAVRVEEYLVSGVSADRIRPLREVAQ